MPLRPAHRDLQNQIRKRLLTWYRRNKRDLPWRKTRDPYRILVSEIMLQQTQVATVIPYYLRFIKTFPAPSSLARSPLRKVLKLWEGLGYYGRARNLHRAARVIQEQWKGQVPPTVEGLTALPGVGRYTAGAIASIAFDVKAPVLDGNVSRVLCRIFAIRKDPRQAAIKDRLWKLAAELLPEQDVGDFNQALMELGATVCLPRTPSCLLCPVRQSCQGYRLGLQERLPIRAEKRIPPRYHMVVALIQDGRGLLIGPRPERGLLAGLWSFPEMDWKKATGPEQIGMEIEKRFGLKINPLRPLAPVAHTFSHKRITYYPYLFNCVSAPKHLPEPWRWIPAAKITDYPLPNATRKIFDQLAANFQRARRARGESSLQLDRSLPLAAERATVYRKMRK